MPGGTVQVAARRPSAQVTARWADTQRAQRPLVLRLTTAQRVASDSTRTLKGAMGVCSVMLVGMVQWKAPHRSAQATVRRVGTRGTQRQLAPRRTTASHVMPVGTVLALAQRRSAQATARRVGTQRAQRQPAPRLTTASAAALASLLTCSGAAAVPRVMLVGTVLAPARHRSAQATVHWVDTQRPQRQLGLPLTTAWRVMLVGMARWAARQHNAQATVR